MAKPKPKRVVLCKKKQAPTNQKQQQQQQQGSVEHSPSSHFITLRISPEKYQEKFASSEGRLLLLADHTRSKDPTPASRQSLPAAQSPKSPTSTNSTYESAVPQPKAPKLILNVGTKRKSALKQAAAPPPKLQKHVRLLVTPDYQVVCLHAHTLFHLLPL